MARTAPIRSKRRTRTISRSYQQRNSAAFRIVFYALLPIFCGLLAPMKTPAQVRFGVRGGVNFANEIFDPEFFTDIRRGIIAGIAIEAQIDETFRLALQPQYVQKGAVVAGAFEAVTTVKLNYLEFPTLFTASYTVSPLMVYAFIGPNVGMLVSAVSETVENGTVTRRNAANKTESIDFAIDFGGGVGYELSERIRLIGDIRYSHGLSNVTVSKTPTGRPYGFSNSSRDLKIAVGFMIPVD